LVVLQVSKYNLKDSQGAIADFDKTIELKPKFAQAYGDRGDTKSRLGDDKGAIVDYDRAISIDSNNADYYWKLLLQSR
jgi:tetratricopeptide (TPR) repeat protein